jgi:dolichol-phosphate mannosyltransferase
LKVAEVPIIFTDRFVGSSKMSRDIVYEAVVMVWRLWAQDDFWRWPQTN